MHRLKAALHLGPQSLRKYDFLPVAGLAVIQSTCLDIRAKHFLQAHSLGTELKFIGTSIIRGTPLVLDGEGMPAAVAAPERNTISSPPELHHIALARNPQYWREYLHAPRQDKVAPALPEIGIMGPLVHQRAIGSAVVLCP